MVFVNLFVVEVALRNTEPQGSLAVVRYFAAAQIDIAVEWNSV